MIIVPLVNRIVPIIFDEYVDKEFGTGALKVTPAHDINDYNLGLKHHLEIIDTLNEDGTLSEAAKVFVGLDRFEARKKAIEQLKSEGLLVKEEEYISRIGYSQRTNAVVEPRISTQWFVKMKELAGKALDEVVSKKIKIHPEERFLATYKYWLENVKDWCICRQLWWGQRIPAWYAPDGSFTVAESIEEAFESFKRQWSIVNVQSTNAIAIHHSPFTIDNLLQDEDVLDTWFSSWLWPIEVFNGISDPGNDDIKYYYPTSVLVTGQDIIFFWVARMIMAGMEYMNEKPFSDVYFTGMVRDKQGRKMSKSLGNSPDLLDLIDKYGADAVRFGIMISSPAGNDLLFDESSLEQGRNFNNKLWNALKLVRSWQSRVDSSQSTENFAVVWFENRLNEIKEKVEELYKDFRLSEALKTIYSLIWDDFCSWYLEWVKPPKNENIDSTVYQKTVLFFEELLQLLHPFMPFITEEIYHLLNERKKEDDLTVRLKSEVRSAKSEILKLGEILKADITAIRDARNKNNIKLKDKIKLQIETEYPDLYKQFESILSKQTNSESINYTINPKPGSLTIVGYEVKIHITTNQEIDNNISKEQLQLELKYLQGFLNSVNKKLSNERFIQNASPDVVSLEQKKKADAEAKIRAIEESLSSLQ